MEKLTQIMYCAQVVAVLGLIIYISYNYIVKLSKWLLGLDCGTLLFLFFWRKLCPKDGKLNQKTMQRIDSIKTFSGNFISVKYPQINKIELLDIAVGLSRKCRFAGQTIKPYTVLQHCLLVASLVPEDHKLAALLHDASEAYLEDIPTPLKKYLPNYNLIEREWMIIIAHKYGFQYPLSKEVKLADKQAFDIEYPRLYDPERAITFISAMSSTEMITYFMRMVEARMLKQPIDLKTK